MDLISHVLKANIAQEDLMDLISHVLKANIAQEKWRLGSLGVLVVCITVSIKEIKNSIDFSDMLSFFDL